MKTIAGVKGIFHSVTKDATGGWWAVVGNEDRRPCAFSSEMD
jgi:hypothetical protein